MAAAVAQAATPPAAALGLSAAASPAAAEARAERLLAWLRAQPGAACARAASLASLADCAALCEAAASLAAAPSGGLSAPTAGPTASSHDAAPSARLAVALRALDAAQGLSLPLSLEQAAERVAAGDLEATTQLLTALHAKGTVMEWARRAAAAGIVVAPAPEPAAPKPRAASPQARAPAPPRHAPPARRPATPPRASPARTAPRRQAVPQSSSSSSSKGSAPPAAPPPPRPEDWRLQPTALRALLRAPPAARRAAPRAPSPAASASASPAASASASAASVASWSPSPQTSRRRATPPREAASPPPPRLPSPPRRSIAVQELIASLARNATLQPLPPPPPQRTPRRTWDAPQPVRVTPSVAALLPPSPPRAALRRRAEPQPPPPPAPSGDIGPSERQARALHAWLASLRLPACPVEATAQSLAAAVSRGQLLLQLASRLERRDLPGVTWQPRGDAAAPQPRAARAHDLRVALETLSLQPAVPRRHLRAAAALLDGDADVAMALLADLHDAGPYRWARAGLAAGGAHPEHAALHPRAPLTMAPAPRRAAASAPPPSVRASLAAGLPPFQRAACSAC